MVQHEPESEETELLPKLEPGGEGTGEWLARSATDELDETGDRTGEVGKREHCRSAACDDLWVFWGGVGWVIRLALGLSSRASSRLSSRASSRLTSRLSSRLGSTLSCSRLFCSRLTKRFGVGSSSLFSVGALWGRAQPY